MKITRKFIAEKAGVAPCTVSFVLNKDPKARVGEPTRKRILQIAQKYNYFPNIVARSLVTSKTFNIGFITTQKIIDYVSDAFQNPIFAGLESEIEENGYSLLFSLLKPGPELNLSVKKMICGNTVDGIILCGKVNPAVIDLMEENSIKYVLVDYYFNDRLINAVLPDNVSGSYRATKYLIQRNLKKIICINGDEVHPSYDERAEGYKKAMDESGLKPEILVSGVYFDQAYQFMTDYLKKNSIPEAFFITGHNMALGTLHALKAEGYKIPEQVKLIGFDNTFPMQIASPPLSTVDVPKMEMGRTAVRLLIKSITKNIKPGIVRLPTELVLRESA